MRYVLIGCALLFILAMGQSGCSDGEGQAAAEGRGSDPRQLYERALDSLHDNRIEEAMATLREMPVEAPEAARAHNLLGVIHARFDRPSLARLELEHAIRIDPALADAQSNLGVTELDAGRLEAAEAAFRSAIAADPYMVTAHHGLAAVYARSGRIEKAKAELATIDELGGRLGADGPSDANWLLLASTDDVPTLVAEHEAAAKRQAAQRDAAARKARQAAAARSQPATRTVTRQLTVPQGTVVQIALGEDVSTATARVGQELLARVVGDVVAGNQIVIADSAPVRGRITEVESSGRVKGRARLGIEFHSVETVAGWRDIEVSLVEGTLVAEGTKKRDAAKIGIGAIAGAVLGEVIAENAAAGAAIGGAAGTAVVLATKGKEIELDDGTRLDLALDTPCSITVRTTEPVD